MCNGPNIEIKARSGTKAILFVRPLLIKKTFAHGIALFKLFPKLVSRIGD